MRKIEINLYKLEELKEDSKQKAMRNLIENWIFHGVDDAIESIKAFCGLFYIKVVDYNINELKTNSFIKTDFNLPHIPTKEIPEVGNCALTGYYLDDDLLEAYHSRLNQKGDIEDAFKHALNVGLLSVCNGLKSQLKPDYLIDYAEANGLEFLENGDISLW